MASEFADERQPFSEKPKDYKCPVCSSPKRKFRQYKADFKGRPRNDQNSMQERVKAKEW
jgi:hypothetical protein